MKLDIQLTNQAVPIESEAEQRAWEQAFEELAQLVLNGADALGNRQQPKAAVLPDPQRIESA